MCTLLDTDGLVLVLTEHIRSPSCTQICTSAKLKEQDPILKFGTMRCAMAFQVYKNRPATNLHVSPQIAHLNEGGMRLGRWLWSQFLLLCAQSRSELIHNYSGTPLNGHPWIKANCDITARHPGPKWTVCVQNNPSIKTTPTQLRGTPLNGHPWINGQLRYNSQAPRSQMNSLCTKQPLNKGHPYNYNGQNVVPQEWPLYRGVPLYISGRISSLVIEHNICM